MLHAAVALLVGTTAFAQESFRVFLGPAAGTEQIAMTRTPEGWTITGSGQIGAPVDVVTRRLQVRYTADWKPIDLSIDGTIRGQVFSMRVSVEGTTATAHVFNAGQTVDKSDTIDAAAVLIAPGTYFAPFAALAERVKDAAAGSTVRVYVPPQGSFDLPVGASTTERIQTVSGLVSARRTAIQLLAGGSMIAAEIWSDANGRLLRFTIPTQGVDVVREDLASVSSRQVTISRPNDEQIKFGSNGVTLAGTLSRPKEASSGRLPAVVLVTGSGPIDRDSVVLGIPIMGEIAGAIADGGCLVLRYDKRGVGQSGGRPDTAALADHAEDLRAAVRWLADRKDVDPKRIAVAGYSEGGAVALLAAEKEKRIAAIALIAANGVTGAELVLAQQKHVLERSNLPDDVKQARVELQKKIVDAAVTGKSLNDLPANVRRQIDNPEYQSLLAYDPSKIVPKVKQPILIVQGELDTQVEPSNADRLEALTTGRRNGGPASLVKVPGVNHLLVPSKTGEMDEYGSLQGGHVSPAVTTAIVEWLKKTLVAR